MEDRDRMLLRWVQQPPTTPLVQYLRDAEREAALRFVRASQTVLDIASESRVTAGIRADRVARIDVSAEAGRLACRLLAKMVTDFTIIDAAHPRLPFPPDSFEAAVSIGPYDWLFLDVKGLTSEVHRVLKRNGRFAFSVPTVRSPYHTPESAGRFRYYRMRQVIDLMDGERWRLTDRALLFQPSRIWYRLSAVLPRWIQQPMVKFCRRRSDHYTHRGLWGKAGYIVVALEKR
jgi:SAM-dependent methyltransferase